MKIKVLVENTSISEAFNCEHGLSLYIETKKHKLLFDVGASSLFAENAKKMDVDLSEIDLVIISHGHYDHGGGLKTFLSNNSKAKIYISKKAFDNFYTIRDGKRTYIGLDKEIMVNDDRFVFVNDDLVIDNELQIFLNVKGSKFKPSGNKVLLMEEKSTLIEDDFTHEQNLIIEDEGKTWLLAGCAHNGIVNIVEHMIQVKGSMPDYVIGGFHLYNRSKNIDEDPVLVQQIGDFLKKIGSKYYTCHCTGMNSYNILKEIMGDHIEYLATGNELDI